MDKNGLRKSALNATEDVQWMPDWGKARIQGMIENRPDWCISRQRTWGVPIPLFVHTQTNERHPDTIALMEKVALLVEEKGIEAWFDLDAAELLGNDAEDYLKVSDTLDVWFDSGVTHYSVVQQREQLRFPADLYLEGSDQHRGWFQSSLLTSIAMQGKAPYRQVLTHGFTVTADGHKMSKSLGNAIAPQTIIKKLGADILRLYVASNDYSREMAVSDEIIKRTADAYRRIRNTSRFLLGNLNGFEPDQHQLPMGELLALDRWIVGKADELQEKILATYEEYQFHNIYQLVLNFCTVELGSFYLDVIKDRQYTCQTDSKARRSTQTAMHHVLEALTRWLAPILTFTAEEIWPEIPGEHGTSVLYSEWYTGLEALPADSAMGDDFWSTLLHVREIIGPKLETLRNDKTIGSSLDAEVDLYCDDALYQQLASLEDELRFALIASYARIHPLNEKPDNADTVTLPGGSELAIAVIASEHEKCVRCWHHREDVGKHNDHPELCGRCVENVDGKGEERRYA